MANYIPDILSRRWVLLSPQRLSRPEADEKVRHASCIFCYGNEDKTPPEVLRYGGGETDKPGWKVRIVPNKYPITDIHEVIIHSPDCNRDIKIHQSVPEF